MLWVIIIVTDCVRFMVMVRSMAIGLVMVGVNATQNLTSDP